jgi:hypothetical protein
VSEQIIDSVTRHAAGAVSRRASLLALGGMVLAAMTAVPAAAKGGNKGKKRKKRNAGDGTAIGPLAQARCASQIDVCRQTIAAICGSGDSECLAKLACCDFFATCNAGGALACIFPDS